jgi:hypothetical protein
MVRSSRRTKSIGVKVSEANFATLQALAEKEGKPVAEWCREALLEWAEIQQAAPAEPVLLLAELLGLRTILVNLFFKFANAEPVTPTEMQQVIERADAEKFKKALARFKEAKTTLRAGGWDE